MGGVVACRRTRGTRGVVMRIRFMAVAMFLSVVVLAATSLSAGAAVPITPEGDELWEVAPVGVTHDHDDHVEDHLQERTIPAEPPADEACQPGYKFHPGMGCARSQDNGLFEVTSEDGSTYSTHGPDPETPGHHGTSIEPGDPMRAPTCRAAGAYRTVILYTYLSGNTNNVSDSRATIRDSIKRSNYVLDEESQASSSSSPKRADYEVRCNSTGSIYVGAYASSGRRMAKVFDSAKAAGFNLSTEKYLIFADFSDPDGSCGYGELYNDTSKSTSNYNNGRSYGVSYKSCWTGKTPMHEWGHMMGAVQSSAPDSSGAGHCNDGLDVMCYADGGPKSNYSSTVCTGSLKFDCRKDSYFDTLPESGEWLDTNWNLGWTGNRFLYIR